MFPPFQIKEENLPEDIRKSIHRVSIDEKLRIISEWLRQKSRIKSKYMLYIIMYDIENNKIRTHIAKYLIRKGCMRIQKSIYIIKDTSRNVKKISKTLQEINEAYNNADSIFILPIPQEKFNSMKVIGKNITFDIVTKPKNVLIF